VVRSKPESCRALAIGDLLLGGLDLLLGGLDDGIDEAVDGPRRRALATQDQRGLAGEGGGHHAGRAGFTILIAALMLEAELLQRETQHGRLPGAGIAEQPEYLLLLGVVLEPVADGSDRAILGVGGGDARHAAAPSWTW